MGSRVSSTHYERLLRAILERNPNLSFHGTQGWIDGKGLTSGGFTDSLMEALSYAGHDSEGIVATIPRASMGGRARLEHGAFGLENWLATSEDYPAGWVSQLDRRIPVSGVASAADIRRLLPIADKRPSLLAKAIQGLLTRYR